MPDEGKEFNHQIKTIDEQLYMSSNKLHNQCINKIQDQQAEISVLKNILEVQD